MAYALIDICILLLRILSWIIIIQIVISWLIAFNVINTYNDVVRAIVRALDTITEPLYRPIRRIMPDLGMIDLSPMVVVILIIIAQRLLQGLAMSL